MPGSQDEIWITTGLSDQDARKALTLCYSLRWTYTARKIAIIMSPSVSAHLRRALIKAFDMTFDLENSFNTANLSTEEFAKLYGFLALRSFQTCVYLSPSMLVLRNSDDIFKTDFDGICLLENSENTSVFVFKPSDHQFEEMMANFGKQSEGKRKDFFGKFLSCWTRNQCGNAKFLDNKYYVALTKESLIMLGFEEDASIVDLANVHAESNMKNLGLLGKLISIFWGKIQTEHVSPLLTGISANEPMESAFHENRVGTRNIMEPIAIVGMSCRYPGANNLEEFWQLLFTSEDGTCTPPDFRWLRKQNSKPCSDYKNTNAGFLKTPVDEFDAKFFGISPKESVLMDPQHRLLHELVWEGLEDACINPQSLHGTSGSVFMGSWTNEYKDVLQDSGNTDFFRLYMGNSIGAAAARISFLLGMTGPSIATESGCSSAMIAVHLACTNLRNGETNLALACGINMLLRPFGKDDMPQMVSPDGHSKTFSEDANGFARAEGGGVLVLKRLSDALEDGDHIWGVIRGSAACQEGLSKSLGTPTVECESLAMTRALRDAQVQPEQVSYVEAHGTGTVVGDPMEVQAIAKAYRTPKRKEPLIIGSVKTNVGHTESCSGITGIMKVALAMQHEMIPAHINFSKLNPSIDLEAVPAVIPLERVAWCKIAGCPRIAGISSFGITGTDAHVILEEAPTKVLSKALTVDVEMERPMHIIKLSAKTEEAMHILMERYRNAVQSSDDPIADIAYSANTGRSDFPIRAAILARSKEEICKTIDQQKYLKGEANLKTADKICFLFTGQGSQYPEMAKELYETSPVFQIHFDYCDRILKQVYGINVKTVLWPSSNNLGSDIDKDIYSQTSIFCVEYALVKLWESWGVHPDYVLGHSLGEYAAVVCAGILTVENVLQIIVGRCKLIEELPHGKMLAVKANHEEVEIFMRQFAGQDKHKMLDYAAINSNEQTVVAGDSEVILAFSAFCTNNNIKSTVLKTTHAFHSKHMDPILQRYKQAVNINANVNGQCCGYISGVTGGIISSNQIDANYWVRHNREKVNFLKACKKAEELGCRIFLEIGPQPVLSAMNTQNNPNISLNLASLKRSESNWTTLLTSLGKLYTNGVSVNWKGFDEFRLRKKVRLPHYPFKGRKFWPEMILQQTFGNTIHPLLGSPIPNALSSIKLFQSGISLKTHEYIRDHCIGANVIFPGAGYLEMSLVAGMVSSQGSGDTIVKSSRPMKVENLTIMAPFALDETKTSLLQTVVEFPEGKRNWDDIDVAVYRRIDTNDSWFQHARATFSAVLSQDEQMLPFELADLEQIFEMPSEDEMLNKTYGAFSKVGLEFGQSFQSIEKLWRNTGQASSILVKVKVPIEDANYTQHVIHPIILDAMIQAITIAKQSSGMEINKLYVPVKVGKFIWLGGFDGRTAEEIYVQVCEEEKVGNNNCTAVLINRVGKAVAVMSAVELVETTVRAMELALEQQTRSMPDLWEEVWRAKNLPAEDKIIADLKDNETAKYWLVFHQDDDHLSNFLLESIPKFQSGRKAISISKSNKFENTSKHTFKMRADNEQDFAQLMELINDGVDNVVEGIVYCWSLDSKTKTQEKILMPYFLLTKTLSILKQKSLPNLYALTRSAVPVEDNDLSNFYTNTIWGFTRSLQNEKSNLSCKCIDVGNQMEEKDMQQVYNELWSNNNDTQIAFFENRRYVPKFIPHKQSLKDLELPMGTSRFQLIIPETKSIGDLQFGPLECFSLTLGEIEIQVKSSALNFRDVFSVLKPSETFESINSIGFDFAGVVSSVHPQVTKWSVGDLVFGVNFSGTALPSHVRLREDAVFSVPDGMTLTEACTLPAVVMTSYHCLIDVAKIKPIDTVLIHTASGGVGLSAIEICKHVGATIFATAGSKRKQDYLRSLGIQHVFHSRNTEYGDKIMQITNGRGVDVILNSLTSAGFKEATLKASAKGARFVEMSKLNIWTPEDVQKLRPDVAYTVVDVSTMDHLEWRRISGKMMELLKMKIINPIPYVCFNGVNIREALQYLQKAKHIGKVVCTMPEIRHEDGRMKTYKPLFNDRSTYLITGGLGGIGFEVCKWMLKKGARYVLLAGRSSPKSHTQQTIDSLNVKYKSFVKAVQIDISDFQQCQKLLQVTISEMGYPGLRGVMHAAGTLRDGLVENQSWETLSSTLGPKVNGTLNLHELTKSLKLEHFVLFSSIATLFGSPGQSNYSAGNGFEDVFAHYRRSIGLPSTTVNWGVWGEVGIATEVDLPGIKPFPTMQGISALEYSLKCQKTQIAAVNIDSFSLLARLFPHISTYVDENIWISNLHKKSENGLRLKADSFWQEYNSAESLLRKVELLKESLKKILRNILKLEESDIIEDNTNFYEIGVDSLMFIEVKNALQSLLGDKVTVGTNALRDMDTVQQLTEALIRIIEGDADNCESNLNTRDRVNALIQEDCQLHESITPKNFQKTTPVNKIACVLLTGCTGTLGPYVLKELSAREHITQIICLIRPDKTNSGEQRLRKIFLQRNLLSSIDMSKVQCIEGNVALPNLNMTIQNWEEFSNEVDAVFHCAASVQHVEQYDSSKSAKNIRAVNVQGTKNILEFACSGAKLKRIYFASSIVAVSGTDEQGKFLEDWPESDDFNGVTTLAYPVTKYVGDMLMKQAVLERGVPAKAFRFPLISGDSQTGRFIMDQNHVMLRYLFILKHGVMPNDPMPIPILPVDICAWASVQLFFDPNVPNDVYNVCNAAPAVDQEFIKIAQKLGYNVETVEFSEFTQKIRMATVGNSPFAIFKEFYGSSDLESTFGMYPWLQQWLKQGGLKNDFMVSKKIVKHLPSFISESSSAAMDHIYRDLLFAKQQGWLKKYCQ